MRKSGFAPLNCTSVFPDMPTEIIRQPPTPLQCCEICLDPDTTTTVRQHGNPAGPRLVLSHGNGHAIDMYWPFWSLLTDDFELILYDIRNHGWNTVGRRDEHNIPTFILDQERIFKSLDGLFGRKSCVGIFHSLSAVTALLSFTMCTTRFSPSLGDNCTGLVLFDPPFRKGNASDEEFDASMQRVCEFIRRRTCRFADEEEFCELLYSAPGFSRLVPGALELMAHTLLCRSPDETGYEPRCPREFEAQVLEYITSYASLADIGDLPIPTKVIGSDPTLPFSFLPSFDLRSLSSVDYEFIPETTHFLQIEQPGECARIVRKFLEQQDLP